MTTKRQLKYLQGRYRRELERFLNRVVNFVRGQKGDKEAFDAYVRNCLEKLEAVEKVPLYSDYYERLERFVALARGLLGEETAQEEAFETVAREANRIRKSRRIKSYSRRKGPKSGEDF